MTLSRWKVISLRLLLALAMLIGSTPTFQPSQRIYAADDPPVAPVPIGQQQIYLPVVTGEGGVTNQAPDTQPLAQPRIFLPMLSSDNVWFNQERLLEPFQINVMARAASNTPLKIVVVSARSELLALDGAGVTKGDLIPDFRYLINVDNTGTTTQRNTDSGVGCSPGDEGFDSSGDPIQYPKTCRWTSIAGAASNAPVYTQGNQDDFNGVNSSQLLIPDGRYLISVMADGYKLDGVHFTAPVVDASGVVTVELQPFPLPTATIQAWVFEDISPTNSAPDAPIEHGLAGFSGHINDYIGEVSTDVYGNPLCTEYERDGNNNIIFDSEDFTPTPIPGTGGECLSDENGYLVIPNLGTNRYALSAIPPDGTSWIQTTTLEGNHDWDAWVMEGATGLDTEFVVAGEPFPVAIFGFVNQTPSLPSLPPVFPARSRVWSPSPRSMCRPRVA